MANLIAGVSEQAKGFWGRFTGPQRWLIIGLGIAIAAAVGLGVYLNRDEWVVLAKDLQPKDAAAVVARLNELKVRNRPTGDGYTIQVPESELYTAKLALVQADLPRGGASPGMELFDNPSITASDFVNRVNYARAQQGEMERALMRLECVDYANVKIVPAEESVFIRDKKEASASVLLAPKAGCSISRETVQGVVSFVSKAVKGLPVDNVVVIDQAGRPLSDGSMIIASLDDEQSKQQAQRELDLEKKVIGVLEPVFGIGNVRAKVNLEMDWQGVQTTTETLGPSQKLSEEWNRERSSGSTPATTGTVDPKAPPAYNGTTPPATTDSSKDSGKATYVAPKTTTVTSKPGGSVKRVTVAVTVNSATLTDTQKSNVSALAASATGAVSMDVAVMAMPFNFKVPTDQLPSKTAPSTLISQKTLTMGLGGLALLLLLVVIVSLRRKPEPEEAYAGFPVDGLAGMPGGMLPLDAAAGPLATVTGRLDLKADQPLDPALVMGMSPGMVPGMMPGQDELPPGYTSPVVRPMPGEASLMEQSDADLKTDSQQHLEFVMASRKKRQLVIGDPAVPPEMVTLLEDIVVNTPEAAAGVLREWISGQNQSASKLTGRQKAAVLCINLGSDLSAQIVQHLTDDEIETITVEIARAEKVTAEQRDDLFQEFIEVASAQRYINVGGIDYARSLLSKALGERRANDILQRLTSHLRKRPFDSVRRTDPSQLASFLANEHPQTVAVVLAHLEPDQAALVIGDLPQERQADIIRRVATLDPTSPEMLREAERVLERKMSALVAQESTAAGGVSWVVDVLNRVDRSTERSILGQLSENDPELANEISQRMFLFEDIVTLDDLTVQRVLRDVDMTKDLPLALKAAKEAVWQKILRNVSRRTAETLKEAVDLLGPVRIRDVEEAQARVVALIRKLDEMGEIQVTRGAAEDEYI